MKLDWEELVDDNDNQMWEAPSPYTNDGVPIMWRLKQGLRANKRVWFEDHDIELMAYELPQEWPTLHRAFAAILKAHKEIIEQVREDNNQ